MMWVAENFLPRTSPVTSEFRCGWDPHRVALGRRLCVIGDVHHSGASFSLQQVRCLFYVCALDTNP